MQICNKFRKLNNKKTSNPQLLPDVSENELKEKAYLGNYRWFYSPYFKMPILIAISMKMVIYISPITIQFGIHGIIQIFMD